VRQDLRQWLDELHRELGVTSLLVTHDQEEALELANQIVVMHEGLVQQVGAPNEIYDDPTTPFVAGFVGSANVLHGVVEGGHVHLGAFRVAGAGHLAEGSAATAFVRPHDVRVRPNGSSGHGTDEPTAIGRVERISSLGWLARLTIRLDGEGNHTLVAHVPQSDLAGATEGDLVSVDLRNPKAFDRAEAEGAARAPAEAVPAE
jgi:sulfate transport system ATP-binding protein